MTTATESQQRDIVILAAIDRYALKHEHPPTLKEIATMSGFSGASALHARVERLIDDGYIERCKHCPPEASRALRISRKGREVIGNA